MSSTKLKSDLIRNNIVINIILTIDYEIFGDGSGDVKRHIIKPFQRILDILEKNNVPITIMFEICEFLKYIEYDDLIRKNIGYSYAEEIKKQLLTAYFKGHDIQLHIHPQWVDAVYHDKNWIMADSRRSITAFTQDKIQELISNGKREMEKIIHGIDPNYSCKAMRLTNLPWCEAPPEIFQSMVDNDIVVHSLSTSESPHNTKKGYWYLDGKKQLVEIPIHSIQMPKYKMITPIRIFTALYRRKYSKVAATNFKNENSNNKSIYQKITEKSDVKWDFCKQTSKEMKHFLQVAMKRYNYISEEIPLVMISHSKDFFNDWHLNRFLEDTKKNKSVTFLTLGKFIQNHLHL